jgi:hypothetical protein
MSQKLLKELKKKLPYKYGVLIAQKSGQISVRRVKAVFNGEVKDPKKILQVIVVAEQIIKENEKNQRRIKEKELRLSSKKVK